jgi:hypothetical protein
MLSLKVAIIMNTYEKKNKHISKNHFIVMPPNIASYISSISIPYLTRPSYKTRIK